MIHLFSHSLHKHLLNTNSVPSIAIATRDTKTNRTQTLPTQLEAGGRKLSKWKYRYIIRAFVDTGTRVRLILTIWGVCGQRSRGGFREAVARVTAVTREDAAARREQAQGLRCQGSCYNLRKPSSQGNFLFGHWHLGCNNDIRKVHVPGENVMLGNYWTLWTSWTAAGSPLPSSGQLVVILLTPHWHRSHPDEAKSQLSH